MHVLQTGSTFRLLGLRARWATQANGTSVGRQRPRFGGTHPTNWSVGFSSMQMRHVKSVGGGLRGLGLATFLGDLRWGGFCSCLSGMRS